MKHAQIQSIRIDHNNIIQSLWFLLVLLMNEKSEVNFTKNRFSGHRTCKRRKREKGEGKGEETDSSLFTSRQKKKLVEKSRCFVVCVLLERLANIFHSNKLLYCIVEFSVYLSICLLLHECIIIINFIFIADKQQTRKA